MTNTEGRPRPTAAAADTKSEAATAAWLLTPQAIRAQCSNIFDAGLAGRLRHFSINLDRLPAAADAVCDTIRANYPSLDIPPHARWRHFVIDGTDHWANISNRLPADPRERARVECETAITSVLLDAGAGADWRFKHARSGKTLARSEGLAIASLDLYTAGGFSSIGSQPLRADAEGLQAFSQAAIEDAFQVTAENPLTGAAGRVALIQQLGRTVARTPAFFGANEPRLGNIVDALVAQADGTSIQAREILITILNALGPIWPGRIELADRNLGDTWHHPAAGEIGLVPFHKLSQWLTYSLFEPLGRLGLTIDNPEALTGLAEYRNGGLFIDTGVLTLINPAALSQAHEPGSELVVEWRALTIRLLDEVAQRVRSNLGRDERQLPLASILEGGTWATGRRLAAHLRPGGGPPINIKSDGSVF